MATSQEQIARSIDQLTADQEQMTGEITGDRAVHPFKERGSFAAACLRLRTQARTAACLRPGVQAPFRGIARTDGALTLHRGTVAGVGTMRIDAEER